MTLGTPLRHGQHSRGASCNPLLASVSTSISRRSAAMSRCNCSWRCKRCWNSQSSQHDDGTQRNNSVTMFIRIILRSQVRPTVAQKNKAKFAPPTAAARRLCGCNCQKQTIEVRELSAWCVTRRTEKHAVEGVLPTNTDLTCVGLS